MVTKSKNTRIVNPFTFGGPIGVSQFIGRNSEVNRVFDQLVNPARGSVAIIGERRIGKTSLLHYISAPDVIRQWNLNEEQSVFIFQDCGAVAPFTISRFWKTILKRLHRTLERKKADPELLDSIQEVLDQDEITAFDIEFLLDDLHRAGLLIVLILDEFEWLVRTDAEYESITRDFLGGLRALINHVPRTLSLIVATRQSLDKVCRDIKFMGSPFYNNFVFVHLRPFSQEETEILFDQMLAETEITFTKAEKDYIRGLAGNHPLLLQASAATVFDFKVAGALSMEDLFPTRNQFRDLVEHQFEDFWKWSLSKERHILVQLAVGNDDEAQTQLEAWADERRSLLLRGLIKRSSAMTYRLFSSVFQEWLIDNLYRLDVDQWIGHVNPAEHKPSSIASAISSTVFISYSHKDEEEKEELLAQLGVLQFGVPE